MATLWRVISSSVGTKILLALSGLALAAYLVLHLIGNAFLVIGPDLLNEWGHMLITNPLVVPAEISAEAASFLSFIATPEAEPLLREAGIVAGDE